MTRDDSTRERRTLEAAHAQAARYVRLRRRVACVVGVLGVIASASPVRAYRTAGDLDTYAGRVAWQTASRVGVTSTLPGELAWEHADRAIRAAVDTWLEPVCMRHEVEYLGLGALERSDRAITIEWVVEWVGRGFVAGLPGTTDVTYVNGDDGWSIASAAIYLNAEDFGWHAGEGELTPDIVDLQAVVTHELGHALGLLHVCELHGEQGAPVCGTSLDFEAAVMFPEYQGAAQRVLGSDDVDGVCFLYGDHADCSGGGETIADGCESGCDGAECAGDAGPGPARGTRPLGDPCEDDAECESHYCDDSDHCGEFCVEGQLCPDGFHCAAGALGTLLVCEPQGRLFGERCDESADCASALCLLGEGEDEAGFCTRRCQGDAGPGCPEGHACTRFAGRDICATPKMKEAEGGGCAVVQHCSSRRSSFLFAMLIGSCALVLARRRRGED